MNKYANVDISEDFISVSFDAGDEDIMSIGSRMNEICEEAYMNGYNWDAFFNCYLDQNAPEILEVIESDPEAEMYSVFIEEVTDESAAIARKLGQLIDDLFNNEDLIYRFLRDNAEEIEWD
ncbi:MAG: hypothetical protein J6X33_02425 [Clostridiales bacterium]|nr:hypothetical protein [Clostridiales bacterium]